MRTIRPDFFDEFRCTASACTGNCCAVGWEIDVDEATAARYRALPGALGERVRAALVEGPEGCSLAMGPDGCCPLLTKEGLCALVLQYGEGYLCSICTEHPRFYNWYGDCKEMGVGLCCEEACRLLFLGRGPLRFLEGECPDEPGAPDPMAEPLRKARAGMFALLADQALPLKERFCRLLSWGEGAQAAFDAEDPAAMEHSAPRDAAEQEPCAKEKEEGLGALLRLFAGLEFLDPGFGKALLRAQQNAKALAGAPPARGGFYERLAAYGLYRWLIQSLDDGRALARVGFVAAACIVVRALALSESWEEAHAVREFSKEIEYSDDNMEALFCALEDPRHLAAVRAAAAALFGEGKPPMPQA